MRKTYMKQKLTKLEKYWVLYDVGNSAFTLLVSTIIPIYFKNMAQNVGVSASDSTAYLSYAISISTIIVAILGPILGAFADNKNHKKPLFTFFMMIGVLGCAALSIPKTWLMFLIIFVIAKVGFSGSHDSRIFLKCSMVGTCNNPTLKKLRTEILCGKSRLHGKGVFCQTWKKRGGIER